MAFSSELESVESIGTTYLYLHVAIKCTVYITFIRKNAWYLGLEELKKSDN